MSCIVVIVSDNNSFPFASQVIGFYMFNGEHEWTLLLCLPPFLASVFQLITLPFCPESPRWLYMTKTNYDGAKRGKTNRL